MFLKLCVKWVRSPMNYLEYSIIFYGLEVLLSLFNLMTGFGSLLKFWLSHLLRCSDAFLERNPSNLSLLVLLSNRSRLSMDTSLVLLLSWDGHRRTFLLRSTKEQDLHVQETGLLFQTHHHMKTMFKKKHMLFELHQRFTTWSDKEGWEVVCEEKSWDSILRRLLWGCEGEMISWALIGYFDTLQILKSYYLISTSAQFIYWV